MQGGAGPYQQGHPICGCASEQGAREATGSYPAGELMLLALEKNKITRQQQFWKQAVPVLGGALQKEGMLNDFWVLLTATMIQCTQLQIL